MPSQSIFLKRKEIRIMTKLKSLFTMVSQVMAYEINFT